MASTSQQYTVTFELASNPIPRVIKRDIRVIDEDTGHIYMSNLDNMIADDHCPKHTIFTCDHIEDLFARLIERREYKIARTDTGILHVIFEADVDIAGFNISDRFEVECAIKTIRDEDRRIRLLEREVEQLREKLSTFDQITREVAMQKALMDFNMKWGPIPVELSQFVHQIIAAELNGTPYIFECVGPGRINNVIFRQMLAPTSNNHVPISSIEIQGIPYWFASGNPVHRFYPANYDFPWLRSVIRITQPHSKLWFNIGDIKCSRIIIMQPSGLGTYDTSALSSLKEPVHRYVNVGPLVLPTCIRSVIFCIDYLDKNRTEMVVLDKGSILRLAETTKNREVILPNIARQFVCERRIMVNARFTDTIARAIVDPTAYEISADIALELANAWKTTEKLYIPTFDEGAKWDEKLFC